ncbi:MAG: hypothetical protein ACKVOR_03880 [Flavobacteriales bacterium]
MSANRKYRKGLRNNYRSNMPLAEAWMKDIRFAVSDAWKWMRKFRLPVIVAYPDFPSKKTTLFKIADQLGYRLTNKTVKHPEVVIYFEDITHGCSDDLRSTYPDTKMLNEHCTDISKKKVDAVHQQIFGYNTFIDPVTYQGVAVCKSDTNALHDGRMVQCPLPHAEDAVVYQVLIDNTHSKEYVMDYRVAVIGNEVVTAYKKFKRHEVRFTNEVSYSEMHSPESLFSEGELQLIVAFAKAMGAHFCELDVLRNKTDNRIYIIDLNKTPYGPPAGLPVRDASMAVMLLTSAFRKAFEV